jgi:triphosphoribosyl-dephospho-CoA synthase
VRPRAELIAAAFKWACQAELDAPKPGNVHVFASGHRMTADGFVASADAAAPSLAAEGARIGTRILGAVEATSAAIGANTNLGIILLCAPLAAATETENSDLRAALSEVLRDLDVEDAALAFRAIVNAAPAGLGHSTRHDVFEPAKVGLLQAMTEAAGRDRVARQYATTFADVFDLGLPLFEAACRQHADLKWATLTAYLGFLSTFPDSHVVRKHGAEAADRVRAIAATHLQSLQAVQDPALLLPELLAWDASLKANGVNPGTSADLTVATLFAHRLRTTLPSMRNNGSLAPRDRVPPLSG